MKTNRLKIISWNINGIKARLNAVTNLTITEQPEILCLQETRTKDPGRFLDAIPGYSGIINSDEVQSGHAGVAIFMRNDVLENISHEHILTDKRGRLLGIDIAGITIISAYFPEDRAAKIYLMAKLSELMKARNIIICGDYNTTVDDIDHHRYFERSNNCLPVDKEIMAEFMRRLHLRDPYRDLYPGSRAYTYWPYTNQCRERNIGMRIDYTLVSPGIHVVGAEILNGVGGSDHCPVSLTICLDKSEDEYG